MIQVYEARDGEGGELIGWRITCANDADEVIVFADQSAPMGGFRCGPFPGKPHYKLLLECADEPTEAKP